MAAQIGLLVCSLASQGLGGRSALPSVCLRLCATSQCDCIAASTRRCFSSQRPRPKMPCCCYHDNPGGREKGRRARYEKKKKEVRSEPVQTIYLITIRWRKAAAAASKSVCFSRPAPLPASDSLYRKIWFIFKPLFYTCR